MRHLTPIEINKVSERVCKEFCINLDELKSKCRNYEQKEALRVLSYYCVTLNNYPIRAFARMMSKTHGTIYNAEKKIKSEMKVNKYYKESIERIIKKIDEH